MHRPVKPFRLPMTLTHLLTTNGRSIVHSLDFDIVSVAATDESAWAKHILAVKTYVEFGLSKGWSDYIMFPAPQEIRDQLQPGTPAQFMPPLLIDEMETKMVTARPDETSKAA